MNAQESQNLPKQSSSEEIEENVGHTSKPRVGSNHVVEDEISDMHQQNANMPSSQNIKSEAELVQSPVSENRDSSKKQLEDNSGSQNKISSGHQSSQQQVAGGTGSPTPEEQQNEEHEYGEEQEEQEEQEHQGVDGQGEEHEHEQQQEQEAEEGEALVPESKPPQVPEDGTYITALNEAGVEPDRIEQLQNINADEFNIFQQYSEEEIENFKCIFDMFDKDKTGVVNVQDLQTIMKSLGRDPQEAIDLLEELDFDPAGQMSFEEFLRIMKNLENRLVASKQDEMMGQAPGQEGQTGEGVDPNMMPKEGSFEERTKYGCLLPRTGVHFLPDSKVVDFLRLLNDYRKKCCKEMNLTEARRAALKFEDLKNKEMLRQLQNMKQAQEQELITVESAQRAQFLEFSSAWDNYMSDYEATAYLSLEKLKEKHLLEIQQLHERIRKEYSVKITFTKELMEMRKKVQKLMHSKRYEEAEELNIQCNIKEQGERDGQEEQVDAIIEQQEARLRRKQQMALAALLKRIQRDRNEQLKHRQIDSQRLIQRNKNLLLDLLNKQNMETRRTNSFLRFALGARSPDKKKYFKSKLFYDPNEAKLPMSQSMPQRHKQYPGGPTSNSLRALQNHPLSRDGGSRPGNTAPDPEGDEENQEAY